MEKVDLKIKDITNENLDEIPEPCKSCVYWEYPEGFGKISVEEAFRKKKEWFKNALEGFGTCGKIAYVNEKPVAYSQYAPPKLLLQTESYGSKKLDTSEGTIFLSCLFITSPKHRGKGLGSKILKEIISELKNRKFKALETFARVGSANNPSGPAEFFLRHNFHVKEKISSEYVLVRLEL